MQVVNGRRAIAVLIVSLVCMVVFAHTAHAANRYSMINVHPNQDYGRYFFVQESETMPKLKWNLGMMMLYYNNLLNIKWETVIVGPSGSRTIRVDERHGIDHLVYDYFYGAVGVTDWMTLAFDFPLFLYYKYGWTNANVTSSSNQYFKPGDIWLSAKVRILDLDYYWFGISFIPSISLPSGKDSQFLGDQGVTGQGMFVFEIKWNEKVRTAFNIALHTRKRVEINDISFRNTMKLAFGATYDVTDNVTLMGELESHTVTNDFYGSRRTSPTELRLATRWNPGGGRWSVGGGSSVGIVSGVGMPRFGMFASVGYSTVGPKRASVKLSKFKDVKAAENCAIVDVHDKRGNNRYQVVCKTFFGINKAKPTDHKSITEIVELIKNAPGKVKVEVRGWTDTTGSKEYNKVLSLRRAQYVAKAIKKGLGKQKKKAKITSSGFGEDEQAPSSTKARRADTFLR